jgi:DUF4097 and DUF4098 domain-containing protein YvlB
MTRHHTLGLCVILCLVSAACDSGPNGVNGSVDVAAGQPATSVSRVNGSIRVAPDGAVLSANTVNGSIELGARANAGSLNTVNGHIRLGEGAKAQSATNVNGEFTLEKGADVAGKLAHVNGDIRLTAAHVGDGIETVNGNIEVGANSRVEGGIHIQPESGFSISFVKPKLPRVVIGPGAVVQGTMKFERPVKLYVSDTATIGAVEGATPEKFSGPQPPST